MSILEIHLEHVDVEYGEMRALHDLCLSLCGNDHYAVIGDNGAGKTTLLRLLVGEVWPSQRGAGRRVYRVHGRESASPIVARAFMRLVTPAMVDWYRVHDLRVPVWEVICSGLGNTPFLYASPSEEEKERACALGCRMGLARVLERPLRDVSTGQAKRTLLARAMIAEPALLAVDELGQGLDRQGQYQLADALNQIAARGTTRLMVSGHGLVPVPEAVSHRVFLERGRLVDHDGTPSPPRLCVSMARSAEKDSAGPVVQATSCTVVIGGETALDSMDWTVRSGECWGVLGRNGSGKSTLLQLATGYLRPWPGGRVSWFGEPHRLGVAECRNRIGILAPWLKDRIEPDVLGRDVLFSGLCGGLGVHRNLDEARIAKALELACSWGMDAWMEKPLAALSFGQARQLMLARSIVHDPELLVLDEPFSGLDRAWQERMAHLLEFLLGSGRTLLVVTHSPELMDGMFTHGLFLEDGKCRVRGEWSKIRESAAFACLFGDAGQNGS